MKIFPISISKTFMSDHPRKGQPTYFRDKIFLGAVGGEFFAAEDLDGNYVDIYPKIHTIRTNYPYWARIAEEVNAGRGILSLRQWSGSPYNRKRDGSKPVEFLHLTKMGIQKVDITIFKVHSKPLPIMNFKGGTSLMLGDIIIDGKEIQQYRDIYRNDGLFDHESNEDFINWFGPGDHKDMAIIHFTDFRYS